MCCCAHGNDPLMISAGAQSRDVLQNLASLRLMRLSHLKLFQITASSSMPPLKDGHGSSRSTDHLTCLHYRIGHRVRLELQDHREKREITQICHRISIYCTEKRRWTLADIRVVSNNNHVMILGLRIALLTTLVRSLRELPRRCGGPIGDIRAITLPCGLQAVSNSVSHTCMATPTMFAPPT